MNSPRKSMVSSRFQFSISSLVVLTSLAAGLSATFPNPYLANCVLIAFLVCTSVFAWLGPRCERTYWTRFSLVGWACLVIGFTCLDAVERSTAWISIASWLMGHPRYGHPGECLLFANTLFAVCGAFVIATIAPHVSFLKATR